MNFEDILGKAITDPAVDAFLGTIPEQAEAMPSEGREYRSYKKHGIELAFDTGRKRIFVVFLNASDRGTYTGPLPYGIRFSMSRAQVRQVVGRPPDESRDDLHFDAWEEGAHKLRAEYMPDFASVNMIVLMTI